jgi:Tfp pilus assembly protein PilZ
MPISFKEKRVYERIPFKEEISILYGNLFYSGTVLNLSQKGMFIGTNKRFSLDSTSIIFISKKNEYMKLLTKVKQIREPDGYYYGIGVELLHSPKAYLEFINAIRPLQV